ncbi:MAG: CocE/NonD family hydrolase, partial [Planctomycetes bacterium]|nr:CocE/NonD family hydrolase [Planctomycetota bacterium]
MTEEPEGPGIRAATRRGSPATIPMTALYLIALASCIARQAEAASTRTEMVRMRDGVRLATDIYLPSPDATGLPAILIRTPYGRTRYNREYGSWARWGYAVAIQDLRGRFDSEGGALAFVDDAWGERQDGADTIAWLANQPFSNGRIGTVGASAMGITQNLLAPAAPDALSCQYILVAASNLYLHSAYPGGVFAKDLAEGWLRGNKYDESL